MPRADQRHGKRWTYMKGCKCTPCTRAMLKHSRKYGTGDRRIPVTRARERLVRYLERGWSMNAVARETGVSRRWLQKIRYAEDDQLVSERVTDQLHGLNLKRNPR